MTRFPASRMSERLLCALCRAKESKVPRIFLPCHRNNEIFKDWAKRGSIGSILFSATLLHHLAAVCLTQHVSNAELLMHFLIITWLVMYVPLLEHQHRLTRVGALALLRRSRWLRDRCWRQSTNDAGAFSLPLAGGGCVQTPSPQSS